MSERVVCRTPTPGKQPTRIEQWKFDSIRAAILKAVPRKEPGVEARSLPDAIRERLTADELSRLGSVGWYTTSVRLELEVAGELTRLDGRGPVRVVRS